MSATFVFYFWNTICLLISLYFDASWINNRLSFGRFQYVVLVRISDSDRQPNESKIQHVLRYFGRGDRQKSNPAPLITSARAAFPRKQRPRYLPPRLFQRATTVVHFFMPFSVSRQQIQIQQEHVTTWLESPRRDIIRVQVSVLLTKGLWGFFHNFPKIANEQIRFFVSQFYLSGIFRNRGAPRISGNTANAKGCTTLSRGAVNVSVLDSAIIPVHRKL